ncbi:GNAT family N-acetyltransferase [Methanimicrococcus blatticola]|uniref:Putative acetyltransferase n=1 Tax=Methanimicrococcus blatticola TaxID=91560 RepID=A0A484F7B8_9EURY|nr:N-acetyltransferase [Methanimicrococcus blatticola]MBZ3935537.1 N-acetyltransferase [Methanimicrococcus blatticola]MCC2509180.1 N-acetyltransferase [Methanimicrococcus blatticola]TDQ69454.1 putative acetyltransferase [Methanimicrococcus blatticola]
MIIRQETETDFPQIYDFVKTAFQTAKRSDGSEQDFINKLRSSGNYIPELALVMIDDTVYENAGDENAGDEPGDKLIGHIMLTKFGIHGVASMPKNTFEILLLAPLAIHIDYRNKGIGSDLVRDSLKRAKAEGYAAVILVGDPQYYERFGFVSAAEFNIKNKQNIPDENVMILELVPGILDGIEGTVDFD